MKEFKQGLLENKLKNLDVVQQAKNKACYCTCLGFVLSMCQFGFFLGAHGKFEFGSEDFIAALKKNLQAEFVIAVKPKEGVVSSTRSQAFVEKWPGNIEGCNCLGIGGSDDDGIRRNRIGNSACYFNETRNGCKDIKSTPAKSFESQLGSEYDKVIAGLTFAKVYNQVDSKGNCV